jgi:pimeloyl-ACP methyl ester carboxylesterase
MPIHYHDLGTGDPVVFLHSYGPGPTAWITFHRRWANCPGITVAS